MVAISSEYVSLAKPQVLSCVGQPQQVAWEGTYTRPCLTRIPTDHTGVGGRHAFALRILDGCDATSTDATARVLYPIARQASTSCTVVEGPYFYNTSPARLFPWNCCGPPSTCGNRCAARRMTSTPSAVRLMPRTGASASSIAVNLCTRAQRKACQRVEHEQHETERSMTRHDTVATYGEKEPAHSALATPPGGHAHRSWAA